MKLYEAITTIVQEFGKDIVTHTKVINVFNYYNAFDESKTFMVDINKIIKFKY